MEPLRVVLVVGSSFSGSTLVGLLIGTDPRALYAGEVKQIRRLWNPPAGPVPGYRDCTCGTRYGECPFWRGVLSRYASRVDLNPDPGLSRRNLRLLARVVTGSRIRSDDDRRRLLAHGAAIQAIREAALDTGIAVAVECVADSSKSLRSLEALARDRDLDVRVVHLLRDGGGVMVSARRRGRSAWGALLGWVAVHASLHFYLSRRASVPVLKLEYARLCDDPSAELERLGRFLELSLDVDVATARIRSTRHHILGGSKSVRPDLARFPGVRRRDETQRLRRLERTVAKLCTRLVARACRFARPAAPAEPEPWGGTRCVS